MATMVELGGLAWDAGIRNPVQLATAIAVAQAESGGDLSKVGDVRLETAKWGPSIGPWQIRSLKAENGKGTIRDASKLKEPAFNAKAMVSISNGGKDFSPWSVTKATDPLGYLRFVGAQSAATAAAGIVMSGKAEHAAVDPAVDAASSAVDSVGQLAGVVSDAAQVPVRIGTWLTHSGTWYRIAFVVLGVALLTAGAKIVAQPAVDAVAAPALKAAGMMSGAGKVAKATGKGS